jgi:adenylate cyclase
MHPRVLIVDDDVVACRLLGDSLAQSGFRVAAVPDAESALATLAEGGAPELFVVDLLLPRMNGLELVRALRADSRAAAAGIIVVTGLKDRQNLVTALSLGADDFLAKPVDLEELGLRARNLAARSNGGAANAQERRTLTALFADVRGFTPLAERIDPETAVSILNELFDALDRAVDAHGGYVDKFLGDGLMALFGARASEPDHALRACRAALQMQAAARKFAAESLSLGVHAAGFGIGIGVASGEAVVGDVGTHRKRSFTAIGDPVNLAARLQALADRDEVVVDSEVVFALGDGAQVSAPREVVVKGKERPRVVYKLVALGPR